MRQLLSRFFNVFSELTIFISGALGKGRNIGSSPGGVKPRKPYPTPFATSVAILLVRSRRKISVAGAKFDQVVAAGEEGFDVACRLTEALSVLDERDTDEPLAIFAKADAWRHRHIGLFKQELGKREAPHGREGGRDRRPSEHRRVGGRDFPPGLAQPVD